MAKAPLAQFPLYMESPQLRAYACRARTFAALMRTASLSFTARLALPKLLDTGHFALETHVEEIALAMRQLLAKTAG
jgi:hypothetical protein